DGTLSRCFGKSDKIVDLNWAEISALRTVQEPHEPMPRLRDLLEYLAEPGREDVWVLLDIKLDNDADTVMRLIGSTIASVKPSASKPWTQRIVLGIWAAKYLPYCSLHCAHFPLTYIGFLTSYASQFLTVPHVTFNLLQKILYWNPSFIRQAHAKNRAVYVWTVNDEKMMRWSIAKGVDGVITDDPEKFVKVREEWENGGRRSVGRFTAREWYDLLFIGFMAVLFRAIFTWKYPFRQGLRGVEGRKGQA
ncbi:hypothetical protein MMC25_002430, partial [Agyrium rufum]|nr:hypothetical protein [Agyrium rufum]